MNVLHVSSTDLQGSRFNGFELLDDLASLGISCEQAVLRKTSRDSRVVQLMRGRPDDVFQRALQNVEHAYSMDDLLYPWGRVLMQTAAFEKADVVHYHLLHNRVVSLLDLPELMSLKPSVWTFHDPWPMTGHCIHPRDCTGWLTDCRPCPHLDWRYALRSDRAHAMWTVKKRVYSEIDVDVVVASEFMHRMVRRSPLTLGFPRVHVIPFGVDTAAFLADDERLASRRLLGIPRDDYVIFFRSAPGDIKGLDYILGALAERPPTRKTTLLTVDRTGLLDHLRHDYNVIDMGWVQDSALYARLLSASDVFLMPSTVEAFGLMALEAMAAGRPVVCFEGTAVATVTDAPACGVAVSWGDARALRAAIDRLADSPEEASERGNAGRLLASSVYAKDRYLGTLARLYEDVWTRWRNASDPSATT